MLVGWCYHLILTRNGNAEKFSFFGFDFVYFELVTKVYLHSFISLCNKIIIYLSVWNSCIPHNIHAKYS